MKYDGLSPWDAAFEAEYNAILRQERRLIALKLLVIGCVGGLLVWSYRLM